MPSPFAVLSCGGKPYGWPLGVGSFAGGGKTRRKRWHNAGRKATNGTAKGRLPQMAGVRLGAALAAPVAVPAGRQDGQGRHVVWNDGHNRFFMSKHSLFI